MVYTVILYLSVGLMVGVVAVREGGLFEKGTENKCRTASLMLLFVFLWLPLAVIGFIGLLRKSR